MARNPTAIARAVLQRRIAMIQSSHGLVFVCPQLAAAGIPSPILAAISNLSTRLVEK
jgi:hypothetical protein